MHNEKVFGYIKVPFTVAKLWFQRLIEDPTETCGSQQVGLQIQLHAVGEKENNNEYIKKTN